MCAAQLVCMLYLEGTKRSAFCRQDGGHLYYDLEYTVKSPQFFRHNKSVYTARSASFFALHCSVAML